MKYNQFTEDKIRSEIWALTSLQRVIGQQESLRVVYCPISIEVRQRALAPTGGDGEAISLLHPQ
jgi:hypothetical protein